MSKHHVWIILVLSPRRSLVKVGWIENPGSRSEHGADTQCFKQHFWNWDRFDRPYVYLEKSSDGTDTLSSIQSHVWAGFRVCEKFRDVYSIHSSVKKKIIYFLTSRALSKHPGFHGVPTGRAVLPTEWRVLNHWACWWETSHISVLNVSQRCRRKSYGFGTRRFDF